MKMKKGFTLVEVIVVLALMALAASIAIPNLRGATTRAEMDTYRSYCLESKENLKMFCNLLNSGETTYTVTGSNYQVSTVSLTIASGLAKALNSVNRQPKYQYYVIAFYSDSNTATVDPSSTIASQNLDKNLDVIVPVIYKNDATKIYTLAGVWYYSMSKGRIMLTFDATNKDYEGFTSLELNKK